jgi:prevent-host-death family protein
MRQNASELVRRAQAGEQLTITVAGRPAAVLGPVSPRAWRQWSDLAPVFTSPTDPDWAADRHQLENTVADPWDRR